MAGVKNAGKKMRENDLLLRTTGISRNPGPRSKWYHNKPTLSMCNAVHVVILTVFPRPWSCLNGWSCYRTLSRARPCPWKNRITTYMLHIKRVSLLWDMRGPGFRLIPFSRIFFLAFFNPVLFFVLPFWRCFYFWNSLKRLHSNFLSYQYYLIRRHGAPKSVESL